MAAESSIPGWLKFFGVLGALYFGGRACDDSEEKKSIGTHIFPRGISMTH